MKLEIKVEISNFVQHPNYKVAASYVREENVCAYDA